jgi:hypothetical protein
MSKVIWKFPVNFGGVVSMPAGASILTCQLQGSMPVLWAEVDPNNSLKDNREFSVIPTGGTVPDRGAYINTFQVGSLVFHVYEVLQA